MDDRPHFDFERLYEAALTAGDEARNSVDQLQDELVLLDTNNRAFREAVRAAAIQQGYRHRGVIDRLYCVLCEHSWNRDANENHSDKCPLSTEPKRDSNQ